MMLREEITLHAVKKVQCLESSIVYIVTIYLGKIALAASSSKC